jgi:hypothetical protein
MPRLVLAVFVLMLALAFSCGLIMKDDILDARPCSEAR